MEQVRKLVRKVLLKEYIISENLDYVRKYIGDSEPIKTSAESWAKQINDSPDSIKFNFSNDSLDFKKTSYMLEILMYAIAQGGEFTFPTTQLKIQVNPDNIARGIMMYMFPSYNYDKFAKFISGGDFKITGSELEYLDAEAPKMMDDLQNTLINVKDTIAKYLSNGYFQRDSKSFINFLQTALRYPLRDARKFLKKYGMSSIDEPMGDKRTRGDMMAGEEEPQEKNSFNDFNIQKVDDEDDERYSPGVTDKLAVILKLNSDINALLALKPVLYEFFRLRIIGENGSDKVFGNTMSYGDIKRAFKSGALSKNSENLRKDIGKKLLGFAEKFLNSGYEVSKKGEGKQKIPGRIDLLQQFKKEHPESFNSIGQLIASPALYDFLDLHVKEDKLRPKTLFKRIRREIQDYFKDNSDRLGKLNQLVSDSGLINPDTNKPFDGIDYLNSLLKARTEKKDEKSTSKKVAAPSTSTVTPEVSLTEEIIDEDVLDEAMLDENEEEKFSFNDILRIAQASAKYRTTQMYETRKIVRALLLKNSTK